MKIVRLLFNKTYTVDWTIQCCDHRLLILCWFNIFEDICDLWCLLSTVGRVGDHPGSNEHVMYRARLASWHIPRLWWPWRSSLQQVDFISLQSPISTFCPLVSYLEEIIQCCVIHRVRTGPGNPEKYLKFSLVFSTTENFLRHGKSPEKSWKSVLEKENEPCIHSRTIHDIHDTCIILLQNAKSNPKTGFQWHLSGFWALKDVFSTILS